MPASAGMRRTAPPHHAGRAGPDHAGDGCAAAKGGLWPTVAERDRRAERASERGEA